MLTAQHIIIVFYTIRTRSSVHLSLWGRVCSLVYRYDSALKEKGSKVMGKIEGKKPDTTQPQVDTGQHSRTKSATELMANDVDAFKKEAESLLAKIGKHVQWVQENEAAIKDYVVKNIREVIKAFRDNGVGMPCESVVKHMEECQESYTEGYNNTDRTNAQARANGLDGLKKLEKKCSDVRAILEPCLQSVAAAKRKDNCSTDKQRQNPSSLDAMSAHGLRKQLESTNPDSLFISEALQKGGLTSEEASAWRKQGPLTDQQRLDLVIRVAGSMQGYESILPLFYDLSEYKGIENTIRSLGTVIQYRQQSRVEQSTRGAEQANQKADTIVKKEILWKIPPTAYAQLFNNLSPGPSAICHTKMGRPIHVYDVAFAYTKAEEDRLFPIPEGSSNIKRLMYSYQMPRCDCHMWALSGKQGNIPHNSDFAVVLDDSGCKEIFRGKIGDIYQYGKFKPGDMILTYTDGNYDWHTHTAVIDHIDENGEIFVGAKMMHFGVCEYEVSTRVDLMIGYNCGEHFRAVRPPHISHRDPSMPGVLFLLH
jgi:hypothetical protein